METKQFRKRGKGRPRTKRIRGNSENLLRHTENTGRNEEASNWQKGMGEMDQEPMVIKRDTRYLVKGKLGRRRNLLWINYVYLEEFWRLTLFC